MNDEREDLPLIAYELGTHAGTYLARATPQRDWMDQTRERIAYRCLPLVIANQAGWVVKSPFTFEAAWNGGPHASDMDFAFDPVQMQSEPGPRQFVQSHFGTGILTFAIPLLFRTPPGYNLWTKGPTNIPKDGIQALEGMIETDWLHASFTMNWKFTRANHVIRFDAGEPICQIFPYPRGLLESFRPAVQHLDQNPELAADFEVWRSSRESFNEDVHVPGTDAHKKRWQKTYHQGRKADGSRVPSHQTHLVLRDFQSEKD